MKIYADKFMQVFFTPASMPNSVFNFSGSFKNLILVIVLGLGVFGASAQVTLVEWNFPNSPDNATADGGIAVNATNLITLVNANATIAFNNGGNLTNCASSTNWTAGANVKCFVFDNITTTGYTSITFSADMRGNNNASPRDFKVQYRYNDGTWTDAGPAITLTTGWQAEASGISLADAANQSDIDIRVLQTSNTSISNGIIGATRWVGIDNIILQGTECIPSQPSLISGSSTPCLGASQTYSVTNVPGVTYNWTFPAGWNQTAGGTTNSVTVTTSAASGDITVTPTNVCGTGPVQILTVVMTSADDQNAAGADSWIGHVYDGTNFNDYAGHYTETASINQGFGGNTACFDFTSNSVTRSIYTETFSVHYRMNSTSRGLFVADLGSDDGSRLTVDGTLVYNNWSDQAFSSRPRVLMNLTGASELVYDFYENGGGNSVVFQNFTPVFSNILSSNLNQDICIGNSGSAISGNVFGALPAGITLSGTGYQWTYSTSSGGVRTAIPGATSATFTPDASVAPFNSVGTYYIYRTANVTSSNNVAPNPYTASNESEAAVVTVTDPPTAVFSYAGSPFCSNSAIGSVTFTGTTGGTFSASPIGLNLDPATGAITPASSTPGIYTITYTIPASGGCSVVTVTSSATISPDVEAPVFAFGISSTRAFGAGTTVYSATANNSTGIIYSLDAASISGGNSINPATGSVTFSATWTGASIITATASGCNGPLSSTHTVTSTFSSTYYSYQSGDWNDPTTWTFDPGGSTGPVNSVPGNDNPVVILSGRIVTLTADVVSTNHDLTIQQGGILNESTFKFTNTLTALRGGGTLQLASASFPVVTNNTFVTTDGGTTEYKTSGAFDLPAAQDIYYHLTINNNGQTARQVNNLVINGNLYVSKGVFQINNNSASRRQLTVKGNVTVENSASITVGTGNTVTGADAPLTVADGGVAPFLNYYNNETHRVVIQGNFINNGTVRFTNQTAPKYDAFTTTGAATVYFQGNSNNLLTCNGTTDFYNLIVDKGSDQTFTLTVYSTSYAYFRLFGANNARIANSTNANPDVKKALWVRNGTLVLQGLTVIPSLTEGTTVSGTNFSHYYIPANGAITLDGTEVIVLSTADDFTEVNAAYNLTGGSNALYGINTGSGSVSGLSILGKLRVNNGYLSTRESAGLLYWSYSSGQFILNNGTVDTKQFHNPEGGTTGLVTFRQTGGTLNMRGRFRTAINNTVPGDLSTPAINTSRAANGINAGAGYGTMHISANTSNSYIMSGGSINIYDVTGTTATSYAFLVNCPVANINVSGGTVQFLPTAGSVLADAPHLVNSLAAFGNFIVNRQSSALLVQLAVNPLTVLQNLNIQSGVFNANNLDVTIGGNFTIANGTTYTTGTNSTVFDGSSNQTFTINLAAALSLNVLKISKPASSTVILAGSQNVINAASISLLSGKLDDNGKTLNVSGNIFNAGIHLSTPGTGKIVMNNDASIQTIDGDGTGVFQNIEFNKPTAGTIAVNVLNNIKINGGITFSGSGNKPLNLQTFNLLLSASSTISGANADKYIQTSGNAGDGGITKTYSSTSASFVFPIGGPTLAPVALPAKYTPATITINGVPTTYGTITVVPVGIEHPNTTEKDRSLTYYWRVKSGGGFNLGAATVSHSYTYSTSDVVAVGLDPTEDQYVPARFDRASNTWTKGTSASINTATNTMSSPWLTNTGNIDGEYTAGDDNSTNPFGTPRVFYSRINGVAAGSGLWSNSNTWSYTNHTGTANTGGQVPGINDIVIIGEKDSVYLATNNTSANTDPRKCASLQIEKGSALDIGFNPNCSFSVVTSHPGGNGNFRLTTSWNSEATFNFPSGDFSDFNINLGTTELYSTNPAAGTTYWLPNGTFSYGNLILSPLGGSNIIFPNNDLIIYGNLITRGQNADSWFCPAWNTNYPNAPITKVAKTITINGNLDIQGGALIWYGNGAITQNIVVYGDVIVAPNSAIQVYSGATSQNLSIGGSLINNTVGTTASGTTTIRQCNFTTLPVTFFGNIPAFITNTLNNPLTVFQKLTVNKGNSQATSLTVNITGTFTTLNDNWLFLQNGTFVYNRTGNLSIATGTPLVIPASAGLTFDNTNSNITIGTNTISGTILSLSGKLKLTSNFTGNVFIGTNGTTAGNHNDIQYSSGGASAIEIANGNLFVNGQIRRDPSNSAGILGYTQSGGSVTILGNAATVAPSNANNAKLEVLNNGSRFVMTGGTLTLVRGGGGNAFGDLYLRPQSGSVTGGTIVLASGSTGVQTYQIETSIPLNNLTLTGSAGNVATASLMVSPLVLNGNIIIGTNTVFNTNNIYTTFNGNFTNNVGITGYLTGTNLTTFGALNSSSYLGSQTLTGATNFYNLLVKPGALLTVNSPSTILNDLTISTGTLALGSNLMQLKGNFANNARYTDAAIANTGILLNGANEQHISGSGNFGRLELNNTNGARIENNINMEGNLVLTTGILDINKFLLSLGLQSRVLGAPFSASKMIKSDGVFSDVGIRKFFPAGASPAFEYPIGTAGKYTPVTFTITANNTVGYVRVNNINSQHPAVIDPANALNYIWEVESSGVTGLSGTLVCSYLQSDVQGILEDDYMAARLIVPGTSWSLTNSVDQGTNKITFSYSGLNNLGGEYTAGIAEAFPPNVPVYTSNKNGSWSDKTIWTQTGGTDYPCPDGGPNGFIVIVDHEVTANTDYCTAYRTTINNKLKIVSPYFGHNLGTVNGNGTLYLETGSFPAGVYNSFLDCVNNGTVEYGGSGTYPIIADLYTNVPNLLFSGTGTRILPFKDLTICNSLIIDGPTLDNSFNNRKLTILGTMEIYSGAFNPGTGSTATVSFAGSSLQTIGGTLGNFTGTNAFNNFEINNSSGLTINTGGYFEVKGNLLLTNGLINTNPSAPYNYGSLSIVNTEINCVIPEGGTNLSFINGPLTKKINQGDDFLFPVGIYLSGIGNIAGNKIKLSGSKTGTILWTAEYRNPNSTFASFAAPLEGVSSKEYWNVKAFAGSKSIININWDPGSDITPLVTLNGLSDMSIADYNTASSEWNRIVSTATGNNYYGTASTNSFATSSGSNDYTLASLSILRPKAKLDPTGPICGDAGIPVSFINPSPIPFNYTLSYTVDGIAQTPAVVSAVPYYLPTPVPGIYQLTAFTYNNGLGTGVVDATSVTVNQVPTTSVAGPDQTLCGITSTNLDANPGGITVGTGEWSIISGNGGTLITPTSPTSQFIGLNGVSYKLRWTISSGTCISTDDVFIHFTLLPFAPVAAPLQSYCNGSVVSDLQATPPTGSSVTWFANESGGTQLPVNQLLVAGDYYAESNAGSGCLSLTRTKVTVTINPLPVVIITTPAAVCSPNTVNITLAAITAGSTPGLTFTYWFDAAATIVFPTPTSAGSGTYYIKGTTIHGCSDIEPVTVTVNPTPGVTTSGVTTICSGTTTNISLTSIVPSTSFSWTIGAITGGITGASASSGSTIAQTLTNPGASAGTVTYVITPTANFCSGTPVNLVITVNPVLPVSISIAASSNPVCAGTSVTFTATPVNGGASPAFQWKVNGANVGTNSNTYSYVPVNGAVITCVLTSNATCATGNPATSAPVTMTVNPNLPVSVSIAASANPVCSGTSVTFTATPVNGGLAPSYQWKVNGTNTGTNNSIFTFTPGNGNIVTCVLTSNATCATGNPATSAPVTMTVNPVLPVSVSIVASSNPVCSGTSVTYTATPVNGGTTPVYQWKMNGTNVGSNSNTYSYIPAHGNVITCILTSSITCTSGNPATSNAITMTVNTSVGGTLAGGNSPICLGASTGTMTLSGHTGTVVRWERQINSGGWVSINNGGNTTYSETPWSSGTWEYRAVVQAGSCSVVYSTIRAINIDAVTVAGWIAGSSTPICQGASTGIMTLTGSTGSVVRWEKRLGAGAWSNIANTTTTYSEVPTSGGTWEYRALVQSGSCSALYSTSFSMVVNSTLTITLGPNPSICQGATEALLSYTATTGNPDAYSIDFDASANAAGIADINNWGLPGSPISISIPWNIATGVYNGSLSVATYYPVCSSVSYPITITITSFINLTGFNTSASGACTGSYSTVTLATSSLPNDTYTVNYTLSGANTQAATNATMIVSGGNTGTFNTSTLSNPGATTITINSLSSGVCASSPVSGNTAVFTVTSLPSATISYPGSPFCKTIATAQPVTRIGTAGGSYSATPAGLTINSSTGAVTPSSSTAATYTVTYTMAASGGCPVQTATTSVTITAAPIASFSYAGTPYCKNAANPSPTFSGGGVAGIFSSTAGLVFVSSATGQVDLAASTTGLYTVTNTIAASGGCGIVTATSTIDIVPDGSWTGAVNNDWNNPGNWACGLLPGIASDVSISNGKPNYPTLSSGVTGKTRNLTIQNASSVTVSGNTLEIAGVISNSGTFNAANGTIEMKGSIAQSIPANTFSGNDIANLVINNASGVTLGGNLEVTGILKATSGNLNSGGFLKLMSTTSQTALIDGSGAGQVTGNVTMQRYLTSGFGYKYFSSPFQAATVNEFATEVDLAADFPTFYKYDENNSHDSSGVTIYRSGWLNYVNPANLLLPLAGYAINFGPLVPPALVEMTGTVNNGDRQVSLFNNNRKYTKGFNLVGNPYPSPIDWDNAGWTKTEIDNAIYFFNAGNTDQYSGVYSSYVNGVSTGNADNIIASMQGFFVHVSDGVYPVGATLGVTNAVRTNLLNPLFKRSYYDYRTVLRFSANFDSDNAISDAAVIYFDDYASGDFDIDFDALKLKNTDHQVPNIYSIAPDLNQLSINGMQMPVDSLSIIPLGISTSVDGSVTFKAQDISELPSYLKLYLIDKQKNVYHDLRQNTEYNFFQKAGEDNNRLALAFSLIDLYPPGTIVGDMFTISHSDDKVHINIDLPEGRNGNLLVTNMLGQILIRKDVAKKVTVELSPLEGTGIYLVTLVSGDNRQSEKVLLRKDYE